MCEDLKYMLLEFLNLVTKKASWPSALTRARMHLLRKGSSHLQGRYASYLMCTGFGAKL